MKTVIMIKGQICPSHENAEDHLSAVATFPGFISGFVDPAKNRVISFHEDAYPNHEITDPRMKRVSYKE